MCTSPKPPNMPPDQSSGIGMAPTARGLAKTTNNQGEQCVLTFTELVLLWLETWDAEQPHKRQPAADQLRLLEHHARRWDHADHQQFIPS